eukprot:scaffold1875_cov339-Prasinococcus_capsulatus_cf.AAC.21
MVLLRCLWLQLPLSEVYGLMLVDANVPIWPGMDHMTYNERRALGFGTMSERLGRGATLDFDCCNLTQAPVHDPVATPEGAVFEREAILQNLLAQKKDIARRVKLWEAQVRTPPLRLQPSFCWAR